MNWTDVSRLVVLALYLVVVVRAFVLLRSVEFSLRKMSVALIGGIATMWAAFYAYITPVFWSADVAVESQRQLAALLSRAVHLPTAVGLLLVLYVIAEAEKARIASVQSATDALEALLKKALGEE